MALRGNLKDFSLPDVFQLVTFSRKSGVLRIKRADGAEGSVWFREGDVFFAQSNWHAELLGERLVRAQRITPQALERALSIRADESSDGRRLGEILIAEGYITDKVLEAFVSEQIQETIFDLMRWDEGDFDFEATPEIADEDIGLSVSIENVVMEGSRRLDEWTRIRKKIPSMDVVFKMATAPGEGTFEISLKPMEWNLLLLVDGTRSVAELAYATNRTDFEVARIIYGLFSAGLLEFATDAEVAKLREEREEREARLAQIEAERAAAAKEQAAAAQAREAALQEQAEARAQAVAAEKAAEKAAAETPAEAPAAPVELPEFLAGGVGPSAEDAAVLEEMMGAVLQPASQAAPVEVQPEPEPEPEPVAVVEFEPEPEPEPVAVFELELEPEPESLPQPVAVFEPEPEVVAVLEQAVEPGPEPESESESEYQAVATPELEPEIETLEQVAPAGAEQLLSDTAATEPQDDTLAQIQASLAGLAETPAVAQELPSVPEPQPEPAEVAPPASDFAHDLMALGLGELPAEPEQPVAEIVVPTREEGAETVAATPEWEDEPVEPLGVVTASTEEPAPEASETAPATDAGFEGLAESFGASPYAPVSPAAEAVEDTPDFSELIGSLDFEEGAQPAPPGGVAGAVQTGSPLYEAMPDASFDFDEELLREVSPPTQAGGVISTDVFLEDIAPDIDFASGGLTDELSALTGLDRPSRPTASVNKIPEPASGDVLRRDTRVDRDTLLKIIDGIKSL